MKPLSNNVYINHGIILLKRCGLFHLENHNPKFPSDIASKCRKKDYHEVWKLLLEESYFCIKLKDYSFFIFYAKSDTNFSLSYYGCPYKFMPIEDYIVEAVGENNFDPSLIYTFQEEYEQALNECKLIKHPVTFRYDYSPELYHPGSHPASHIHIGFDNNIRICCKNILNPLSFIAFAVRQQYTDLWKNIAVKKEFKLFDYAIRNKISDVPNSYFEEQDNLEMHLI